MKRTLGELCETLDGELLGDPAFVVVDLKSPREAGPEDLVVLLTPEWLPQVIASPARAVVLSHGQLPDGLYDRQLLQVENPRAAFVKLLQLFYPEPELSHWISDRAAIAPNVQLEQPLEIGPFVAIEYGVAVGSGSIIGPSCVLGKGSRIGRNCRIGANVSVASGTIIGDRVIIHPGAVIGADGYGFFEQDGRHVKIPQVGIVRIEDDVEIGANVTIDRGTLGETVIGEGTKIDNLVQIGHNVRIGKHCLLIAQVGIAGSTEIGDHVTLAGQTGVAGHLQIGDGVIAAGKSGITRDVPAGQKISGFPAQEHRKELRQQAALRRLPEMLEQLRDKDQNS
ncbi:MAG TPA: UDP-3-O-(3-hydroxymyristoyl)glucosamine N-acyltransferase [Candidatus Obscuribacterales bacterium]